jgi:hypothetical protein
VEFQISEPTDQAGRYNTRKMQSSLFSLWINILKVGCCTEEANQQVHDHMLPNQVSQSQLVTTYYFKGQVFLKAEIMVST